MEFKPAYEKKLAPLNVPIIAGLMPIRDAKHAAFLHNEIPGITIPESFLNRMENAGENSRQVGIDLVTEMAVALKQHVQGIYLMPFRHHQAVGKVVEAIRKE